MCQKYCIGDEHGHIALYTLVLIPFLAGLTILAVDISGWSSLRDMLQQDADRLVFQAVRMLPNKQRAQSYLEAAAASSKFQITDLQITNDEVSVSLSAEFPSTFSALLKFAKNSSQKVGSRTFSLELTSSAQVVPTDYAIILVDGQSLRPGLSNSGVESTMDALFEDGSGSWPASLFFQTCSTAPVPEQDFDNNNPPWKWWELWDEDTFRRWITQACFNPVLSSLKLSAISLVDAFGSHPRNRLGVITTPGTSTGEGLFWLRHIRGSLSTPDGQLLFPQHKNIGGFWDADYDTPQAALPEDNRWELYLRGEACALLSHPRWDQRYQLPPSLENYGFQAGESSCGDIVDMSRNSCGSDFTPGWLSQCYLARTLQLREAVYWNIAKLGVSPEISRAVEQAIAEMVNEAGSSKVIEREKARRGNLAGRTLRKIFLFSDTLPPLAEFEKFFPSLGKAHIELIVVAFHHANADPELRRSIGHYQRRAGELLQINPFSPTLRVFEAENMEQLIETIVPKLTAIGREVALKH